MAMTGGERQARKIARLKAQARAARKASDNETPPPSESERRVIAFHEAGHAVIACHVTYLETATNAHVKRLWDAIKEVAAALLEKGTLDWGQLRETILHSERLKPLSLSGKLDIAEAKRWLMWPPACTGENIRDQE